MIRKLALLSLLAVVMISCNKKQGVVTDIDINKYDDEIAALLDKEVSISGTVTHICKHGGKKMFLIGENPDNKVVVFAGDAISEFPVELEGTKVKAYGIVKVEEITEATVKEWEAEDAAAAEEEAAKADTTITEEKAEAVADTTKKEECGEESASHKKGQCEEDKYAGIREKIAASKDGIYRRYWIEVTKYESIKE